MNFLHQVFGQNGQSGSCQTDECFGKPESVLGAGFHKNGGGDVQKAAAHHRKQGDHGRRADGDRVAQE